jgi:hypothetical protein
MAGRLRFEGGRYGAGAFGSAAFFPRLNEREQDSMSGSQLTPGFRRCPSIFSEGSLRGAGLGDWAIGVGEEKTPRFAKNRCVKP